MNRIVSRAVSILYLLTASLFMLITVTWAQASNEQLPVSTMIMLVSNVVFAFAALLYTE